jgi:phenylacetate-CoA ligase
MYSKIYQTLRYFWPGGRLTHQYWQELERNQWLSTDEFKALQLKKLQALVSHAYENVPFYRQRYDKVGFKPGDFKTVTDFEKLPFLTRDDVNNHRDELVDHRLDKTKLVFNETGGSTGRPMQFYLEDDFWWFNQANNFRMHHWYGKQEGDKVAWFWGAPNDMPEWSWRRRLRSALMRERYLNAFTMTEPKMNAFAEMLVTWQPYMYKGYGSVMTLFAEFVKKEGYTLRPHFIEVTSEKLYPSQRQLIEEVFGCPVADHYSSREMGTMAYQSPSGKILALTDMRYMEVVANGQVVAPGTLGEVVMTSLTQYACPLIRYKNNDMAIMEAGRSSCGRVFPIIQEILGRTNDFLVSADGKFIHSEFFAYTFRVKPEVAQFQIHQPDREHLAVRLAMRQPVSPEWLEAARMEVQTRFGASTKVTIEVVEGFELTKAGKHRYIISQVKPDFV